MANFPIAEAQLVSLFMQSIVYGIHSVTFGMCLQALLHPLNTSRKPIHLNWLVVAVVLFVVGTADVSFNLYHNLIAFIFYHGYGGATEEFGDISNWVNVMRTVWILLQAMVSDAALIYRCWAIYGGKKLVVLLPTLLWAAATICGGVEAYYTATLESMSTIPTANKLVPFIAAYCTLTLATNLLSTGLIAYRIWSIDRKSSRYFTESNMSRPIRLRSVNRIMIESAILYTSAVAITFILELTGSNALYNVSDVGIELAGISFDLIIIRIGKGVAAGQTHTSSDTLPSAIALHVIKSSTADQRVDSSSTEVDKRISRHDVESGDWLPNPSHGPPLDWEA